MRSKKWYWNIFAQLLNLSIVASFRFYQYVNPTSEVSHKDFRRETARTLIRIQKPRKRKGGAISTVPKAIRYDNVKHFLEQCPQGRCFLCKKNTRLSCVKCEKRLRKECSAMFHKKWDIDANRKRNTLSFCLFFRHKRKYFYGKKFIRTQGTDKFK